MFDAGNVLGAKALHTKVPSGADIYSLYRPAPADNSYSPLLLLLHGYPQNHKMWLSFATKFPEWPLLIPDLPGYGHSTKEPSPDGSSKAHSKKEWAKDMVQMIYKVHEKCAEGGKVIVIGHDRGARLAYRMALDFPELICGLAVFDIVPTPHQWKAMSFENNHHAATRGAYHWVFLAAPAPIPETLIEGRPTSYFQTTIASWMGSKAKAEGVKTSWIHDSIQPYVVPGCLRAIKGACEDYRAGMTHDLENDLPLLTPSPDKPFFSVPVLVLTSAGAWDRFGVDKIWIPLCTPGKVHCYAIGDEGVGHFIVNEAEDETVMRTKEWLATYWSKAD